ncbi:MAG: translation initiation factor IF-2, partial [Acidobacteriota bacterium]
MKMLFSRGIMATINHTVDLELAKEMGDQLGIDVMEVSFEEEVQLHHEEVAEDVEKTGRAPVVTVMGHVDHGKTSLLDAIRKTDVAAGEAGGITQSIGAYHVDLEGRQIVFLDTPGHEAFTMMRARGAKVTDIVILVVAADDGVMPQTIEAIDHAKAAKVPLVVAINKVDKANANLDRVRKELSDHGLLVEDWGGDTVAVPVSALQGDGIENLLEMVLLTADILELKAAPSLPARGVVLEARKDTGRGVVATVVIQDGTLHRSDVFVAGSTWGRVRTMTDDRGSRLKETGPATAVEITGFDELPSAGDLLQVHADEGKVREIADFRQTEERQKELAPKAGRVSLENLLDHLAKEEVKELPVVVKGDVDGSVEVLKDTLQKLSTDKVTLNVIRGAVGTITTNDVLFASASEAIIVGFNVRPERNASQLAEQEGIDIRLHTVIYELLDEVKLAMAGHLAHHGLEETGHGQLDLVEQLVDHGVEADI